MTVGLLLAAGLATIISGLVVLVRQPRSLRSASFFTATFFAGMWTFGLALFLSVRDPDVLELAASFHYAMSAFTIGAFVIFSYAYIGVRLRLARTVLIVAPVTVFAAIMFAAPQTILSDVSVGVDGAVNSASIDVVFYSVYALCFLAYFVWSLVVLAHGRKHASNPDSRNRINYMLAAFVVAGVFGMLFNLILPWMGNYSLIWLGPLGLFVFVWVVYVAMARYQLFDVRVVVIRVSMYAMIIAALGLLYSAVFYVVTKYFLNLGDTSGLFYFINIIVMALVVLVSGPVIRHMGRLVDRWFLRDNYDAPALIARINKIAVQIHDPHEMMAAFAGEISQTLNISFVQIVSDANGEDVRIAAGTRQKNISPADDAALRQLSRANVGGVVVADDVESDKLATSVFHKYKIAAMAPIGLRVEGDESIKGRILMGPKKHKSLFVRKDKEALATIANILTIAIESARYYRRIQDFNETLNSRIKEATGELRSSNRKLQKLDEAKDDFISMASHQLRTPLTSVRGYLSMVLDGDLGKISDDQRRVLSEAYVSSERMAFLIGDFLDVSRLQTGKFELQKMPTRLNEVLDSEISQLRAAASSRKIGISYDPPVNLAIVDCDKNKLRQVMMNMIDNAIFYSHADTVVEVALYQKAGNVFFTVKDRGIGVPRSEQLKLFDKFYRGSNARKVRPDGTGIGLYMARKVVLAHGGSIIFESRENKGSTFGFRIPIAS